MEVIILAGGLGTRLREVISEVPKCMAPIDDKPFLWYLLKYLTKYDVERVVLSVGYLRDIIHSWINEVNEDFPFTIDYAVELEPLGTGGAIRYALSKCKTNDVIVLNGDTFFDIDLGKFMELHKLYPSHISLALKPMTNFDRYGSVSLNASHQITQFYEKFYCNAGVINGGIYCINRSDVDMSRLPVKFSFEKEILESRVAQQSLYGFSFDRYFIDIGIPDDYKRANSEFKVLFHEV